MHPIAPPGRSAVLALALTAVLGIAAPAPAGALSAPTLDTVTVDAPQPETGIVTGRVTAVDPDGDPLSFVTAPVTPKGAVALAPDGGFVYTPTQAAREAAAVPGAPPTETSDTFIVTVSDGTGGVDIPVSVVIVPAGPPAPPAAIPVPPPPPPPGAVRFEFQNGPGAEMWPPEARAALDAVAAQLSSYLLVDQPVSINLGVKGINTPGAPNIASMWVAFNGAGQAGFFPTVVQQKIQTGIDGNGPAVDAEITLNFAERWAFGDAVPPDAYDFKTVALHEMTHALGILSGANQPVSEDRTWTSYDSFLRAPDGSPAIDPVTFAWKPEDAANLVGGNGGLYFGGPNAVAAFGGQVPLFTPDPWATASRSLSHVNALPGYLMEPFYNYGPGIRALSPVEIAMLRDLGYRVG